MTTAAIGCEAAQVVEAVVYGYRAHAGDPPADARIAPFWWRAGMPESAGISNQGGEWTTKGRGSRHADPLPARSHADGLMPLRQGTSQATA